MKLVKFKNPAWNGNGFGTTSASWTIEGLEHIEIWNNGSRWVATDRNTNRNLAYGETRNSCFENLKYKALD